MKTDKFFTPKTVLSMTQTNELASMLTKGCRQKTKDRIKSLVTYDLSTMISKVSWFTRFYISKHDYDVHYCAGQSYPCEIRAIRQEMLRLFP